MLLKKQARLDREGKGQLLPVLAALPNFPEQYRDHWQAFHDLQKSRKSGFDGIESISQSEMDSWFNNHGIDVSERGEFIDVIQSLDQVWQVALAERHEQRQRNE